MKGRLLSVSEVRQLKNGTKVWLEKCEELDDSYDQESKVYIVGDEFNRLKPITQETGANIYKDGIAIESGLVKVYEWIDEPKTYKGSEIIAMIEDGRLKDDDILISADNEMYTIEDLKNNYLIKFLTTRNPFTIKQKPVDYITAANSGRNIRPVSMNEKSFKPYTYWLGYMASNMDSNKGRISKNPLDLINDKWEVEL